jgi:hypothetical protein
MYLRFRRAPPGAKPLNQLHDPPALTASLGMDIFSLMTPILTFFAGDMIGSVSSAPMILGDILPAFIPYSLVLVLFGVFVVWNGGIVLGAQSHNLKGDTILIPSRRQVKSHTLTSYPPTILFRCFLCRIWMARPHQWRRGHTRARS